MVKDSPESCEGCIMQDDRTIESTCWMLLLPKEVQLDFNFTGSLTFSTSTVTDQWMCLIKDMIVCYQLNHMVFCLLFSFSDEDQIQNQ